MVEDADGVIGGDLAGGVEGAGSVEVHVPRDPAVAAGRHGRGHGEGRIEGREEGLPRRQGRDAGEPPPGHQPALEGPPQPLDAALGLGAGGREVPDLHRLEGRGHVH